MQKERGGSGKDCGEQRRYKEPKKGAYLDGAKPQNPRTGSSSEKRPCLMAVKPEDRFLTKEGSSSERYKPKMGFCSG